MDDESHAEPAARSRCPLRRTTHEDTNVQAVHANLLDFLKTATQFMVPIYQRVYSWDREECMQLWRDIHRAGSHDGLASHFTGSIVYIQGEGTIMNPKPALIIDGQQRTTTLTILLAALAAHLETLPADEQEPITGFSPAKVRGNWLTNPLETGDRFMKLILSQGDKDALKAVVQGFPLPSDETSRVVTNYQIFATALSASGTDVAAICRGIAKLQIVAVQLEQGVDNPQLVFEAMNSTGKRLSQTDLIRNFVLMDLPAGEQVKLYEGFWFPMEKAFRDTDERRFDEFVRHYLTLRTGRIPRLQDIYDAFKDHAFASDEAGRGRTSLVEDLNRHAQYFVKMALGAETEPELAARFREIEQLKATVVYPFLLRVYGDFADGIVTSTEFAEILDGVISYLFRRIICRIPTNSLNNTFAALAGQVRPEKYVESVWGRLLTLDTYKRFPDDEEFGQYLREEDLYHLQRTPYFFAKLENDGHKEPISIGDCTIEHVMPQNPTLSAEWRQMLGPDWKDVQSRYLHTLGNLTLTGYNPELSDKPFTEKRDMPGGFRDSHLQLNKDLAEADVWNEAAIVQRAETLAAHAVSLWRRPALAKDILDDYAAQFSQGGGFDWSLAHKILEHIPEGRWTTYFHLAEAVGTSAQPMANHIMKCPSCVHPYRVLTWDGKVSEGFAWSDPDDARDPVALLEVEGITFIDGAADPEVKLAAEDLLALVDEIP